MTSRRHAAVVVFAVTFTPLVSHAHELGIDELRLWVAPGTNELRAELTFDPELTRSLDADLTTETKRERVARFVAQQLFLNLDGHRCIPELSVRELYERGGASSGDVVMLSCAPLDATPPTRVTVTIGAAFPALIVQGSGFTLSRSAPGDDDTAKVSGISAPMTVPGGGSVSFVRERAVDATPHSVAWSYASLVKAFFLRGLSHVMPTGVDHLLFVTALTLGTHTARRRLVWLVSLFTLTHTAAVFWVATGFTTPAPGLVEPLIAASIASAGWAAYRQPPIAHTQTLVLVFGFVHGLGFAEGLTAVEPALGPFLVSVVAFNFGVEAAQILAVLVALGLLCVATRLRLDTERIVKACALGVTMVGVAWTILRLVG